MTSMRGSYIATALQSLVLSSFIQPVEELRNVSRLSNFEKIEKIDSRILYLFIVTCRIYYGLITIWFSRLIDFDREMMFLYDPIVYTLPII